MPVGYVGPFSQENTPMFFEDLFLK